MQSIQPLAKFHEFIGQKLTCESATQISPELAIAIWRERQEAVLAIGLGLADVEPRRTYPAKDVFRELRAEMRGE